MNDIRSSILGVPRVKNERSEYFGGKKPEHGGRMALLREDLVSSRQYLSDIGVWPPRTRLHVERWLDNFEAGSDLRLALSLLEALVHLNEQQITYAALSGFRALSTERAFGEASERRANWSEFLDKAYITFPTGSNSDDTGSGHLFGRILKESGFPEARILAPGNLIQKLASTRTPAPVVFLDDLAGTGSQFCRCWVRKVLTPNGKLSLSELSLRGLVTDAYYVPIAATRAAFTMLEQKVPTVQLRPVYTLETDYYASSAVTRLVDSDLRALLPDHAAKYATKSGHGGDGPYGFGDLGLALSFHHAVPNNALPIFHRNLQTALPDWTNLTS
jgi:hypothetical protein